MTKEKRTLEQKLHSRKIKRPPFGIYHILGYIWKLLYFKKLGIKVTYKQDPRKCKGPCIVVSNHASRMDYIYVGIPLLPHRYNFVAGYNEFFRSHLAMVFRLLQVIPKKNFAPDIYTIKEISRVLKKGGKVMIFPEGMNSISGYNQPCALGSGKLLKHFGVPVYFSKISGGYLTSTKYNLDERKGKVNVEFDILFTPKDLACLTADEIQEKLNNAIKNDDYAWNKDNQNSYDVKGILANNMQDLLYRCPRCGSENDMKGEGMILSCKKCGNGVVFDDKYNMKLLDEKCVAYENPRKWYDHQRQIVRNEILENNNFVFADKVKIGMLPEYQYLKDLKTSEIVGEGTLSISRNGLCFEGVKDGNPFKFKLTTAEVPTYGMCTDVSRFYTFVDGKFIEFYPTNGHVAKWFLVTEEMHRIMGGKWKNFKEFEED